MKYLLIHYIDESMLSWDADGAQVAETQEDRALEAWDAEMETRGILVGGGKLRPVGETTTLAVRGGARSPRPRSRSRATASSSAPI